LSSYYISNHHAIDYNQPGEEAIGRAHEVFRWVREGELKVHVHNEYALADALAPCEVRIRAATPESSASKSGVAGWGLGYPPRDNRLLYSNRFVP
jgi:hypothetical protein